MRSKPPSSRGFFRVRFSFFDVIWASVTPLLALYVRDAYVLSYDGAPDVALYCFISLLFSLIAFLAFRLQDGVTRYFSVHDALDVVKAVLCAELMTCTVLFTVTRLDGIPRSTPLIQALILAAGLVAVRTFARMIKTEPNGIDAQRSVASEHIIMIGSNRLSSLYIKFLEACSSDRSSDRYRVIAVLDDRPQLLGRSIEGVRIVGLPQHLQPIIDELAEHGIRTDRVIVGGETDLLSAAAFTEVRRVCEQRDLRLDFVPQLIGLRPVPAARAGIAPDRRESSGNQRSAFALFCIQAPH